MDSNGLSAPTASPPPIRPDDRGRRLDAAHFIQSIATMVLGQATTWLGSALLVIMLPRYLGDVNLGIFSFAFALISLLGMFANLGGSAYLAKETARDPSSAPSLTVAALALRVPLSLLIAVATVVTFHFAAHDPLIKRTVYALSFGIVLAAFDVMSGTLQGHHLMRMLAIVTATSRLTFSGLAAILLLRGGGPVEVSIAWLTGTVLGEAITAMALLRRMTLPSLRIDWRMSRTLLLASLPFFTWQAALAVYGQIDTVMLKFLSTDAVTGWYAAAWRIVSLPGFVPGIVVTVVAPALAAMTSNRDQFGAISRRAVHVIMVACVPLACGIMLLPDRLTHLFGYPANFSNSWWPIILMAPHIPLVGIDMVVGSALNAYDRQRQWATTAVTAAVLNPLANLIAIPVTQHYFGSGAIGAAAVTTLTELFMLVVGLHLLPAGIFNHTVVVNAAKVFTAALAMAVAVLLTRNQPLILVVPLGAGVYAISCLLLKAVTRSDLTEVMTHMKWRSRGGAQQRG